MGLKALPGRGAGTSRGSTCRSPGRGAGSTTACGGGARRGPVSMISESMSSDEDAHTLPAGSQPSFVRSRGRPRRTVLLVRAPSPSPPRPLSARSVRGEDDTPPVRGEAIAPWLVRVPQASRVKPWGDAADERGARGRHRKRSRSLCRERRWHLCGRDDEHYFDAIEDVVGGVYIEFVVLDQAGDARGFGLAKAECGYVVDEEGMEVEAHGIAADEPRVESWLRSCIVPWCTFLHLCRGLGCRHAAPSRSVCHVTTWRVRFRQELAAPWMLRALGAGGGGNGCEPPAPPQGGSAAAAAARQTQVS